MQPEKSLVAVLHTGWQVTMHDLNDDRESRSEPLVD